MVQNTQQHTRFSIDLDGEQLKDFGTQACFLVQLTAVESETVEPATVPPSLQMVLD